jgi:hypothetical protein
MIPSAALIAELADAVTTICNCRELCGDEAEALRDWQADNRVLSKTEREIVLRNVGRQWAQYQRDAGVRKPISHAERAAINRALED